MYKVLDRTVLTDTKTRTVPKVEPITEPKPQRRYHPDWHCPSQRDRTVRTVRRILIP